MILWLLNLQLYLFDNWFIKILKRFFYSKFSTLIPSPHVTEHSPFTGWVNCPHTAVLHERQLVRSFSAHSWALKFSGSFDSVHWHAPYSIGHGDRSGQFASSVLHRGVILVSLQTKQCVTVSTPLPHDEEHSLETGSTETPHGLVSSQGKQSLYWITTFKDSRTSQV